MKTLIALFLVITLSGCSIFVKRTFPPIPESLKTQCPELVLVKDTDKLSEVLSNVATNYGQYHMCKAKVESWLEWYDQQSKLFNEVK
jgi:hypothetical protein